MKRIRFALCCLLFSLCCAASALALPDLPFLSPDDGEDARDFPPANDVQEAIELQIDGQSLMLNFDGSEEFSFVQDGMVQASFYGYSADASLLYELYLFFPQDIQSGTTVTPEYATQNGLQDCSVMMIISSNAGEVFYYASQMDGASYPAGSSYAMRFDAVSQTAGGLTYTGDLTAALMEVDLIEGPSTGGMQISEAPFSFTMPIAAGSAAPNAPVQTPEPTLRPDMRRV